MEITANNYRTYYQNLIDQRTSFEIYQVSLTDMISICAELEEYIEKHYRKMEVGDTVNLFGSVVTIDGVNVLSANNSGSVQGVERKD